MWDGSQPVRGREAAAFGGGRVENPSHIGWKSDRRPSNGEDDDEQSDEDPPLLDEYDEVIEHCSDDVNQTESKDTGKPFSHRSY